MRESFSEYKKTLEMNLMKITYLYDGDIISSVEKDYSEIKTNPLTSPSFIINAIINIYNESFNNMVLKSREIIISEESTNNPNWLYNIMPDSLYIFVSENGRKHLDGRIESGHAFPGYFYNFGTYVTGCNIAKVYYSPIIEELEDERVYFITDKSIQSLVYSIQNMDYLIDQNGDGEWKHTIKYNLYDCKFNSYKLVVKNISKIRDDKINQVLDGN